MNKNQERIARGAQLAARPLGRGKYQVTGGHVPHEVDLRNPSHPKCDCPDHNYRGLVCKHISRALMAEGDTRMIEQLGAIIGELEQELKLATRSRR